MSIKTYAQFISEQQARLRGAGLVNEAAKVTKLQAHVPHDDLDFQPAFTGDTPTKQNKRIEGLAKKHGLKHTAVDSEFDGAKTTKHTVHVPTDHPKYKKIMNDFEKEDIYND